MGRIWKVINRFHTGRSFKNHMYLTAMVVLYALLGGCIWLACGRFVFPGTENLLCFIGYPAVFAGFFGGVLYLNNHEF